MNRVFLAEGERYEIKSVCSMQCKYLQLGQSKSCPVQSFDILLGVVGHAGFTPIRYLIRKACPVVILESKDSSTFTCAQEHLCIKLADDGQDTVLAQSFSVTTVNKINFFF